MSMVVKPNPWPKRLTIGLVAAGVAFEAASAQAFDLTIGGAFDDVDDVLLVEFSVDGPSPFVPFTAFTSVFDPNQPLPGFFDPQLQLFSGTGDFAFLGPEDDDGADGFSADVAGVTFTGDFLDSLLTFNLPVGDFTLGLSSFNNDPVGPFLGNGYNNFGFSDGPFRVHLLGVDEVLSIRGPDPVSPSFPRGAGIS